MQKSMERPDGGGVATSTVAPGPRRLIPFTLVGVLTVTAVLAAVLSAGSSASGSTAVRAALDSTMDATSVTFALDVNLSGALPAQAAVDGSCGTGPSCQVTFSASGAGTSISQSKVIVDNGMVYLELTGPLASRLPTPWVSAPLQASSAQGATGISGVGNLSSVLAGLAKVGDTVTDDGTVTLNGVSTHEYTVTASQAVEQQQIAAMLKSLPSADASLLGTVSVSGYNVNVYVGPDGNLAEVDLNTSVTTSRGAESLSLRLALSGYGQPVSVTDPPANEVTPLSSLSTSSLLGL